MKNSEIIRDPSGRVIAQVHKHQNSTSYYDSSSRLLGTTNKTGTRDPAGRLIADKPFGGLLFPRKR